jgi:hypothetical protein
VTSESHSLVGPGMFFYVFAVLFTNLYSDLCKLLGVCCYIAVEKKVNISLHTQTLKAMVMLTTLVD